VLDGLEALPVKPGTERPGKPVRITEVVIYQDPFEEYKTRQAKKRARQAASEDKSAAVKEKKDEDDVNWFGFKVGEKANQGVAGGGVGKYLKLNAIQKRPAESVIDASIPDDGKKKRKIGFGDFSAW